MKESIFGLLLSAWGAVMLGKAISHYRITEKLGEGGMGVVYKARDTHLDRFVAIKVLTAEAVANPRRKQRFVQEAKAASALNHSNIIHIYDIDQQDGMDFIAMEYVAGKTLDEVIPRKGMRLSEALKYAVQIADALATAHQAGIVHRDLKPGNVMVTGKGQVKLVDFGLAKLIERVPPAQDETTLTLQTEEGAIVGTVAYMSPEQAAGRHVDARSDIFSFGSLLYEMVTGRRAFRGDSKVSTLAAVVNQDPAPLGSDVPRDLDRIITRCLRKDLGRRFQHMGDIKIALEELKEESDSGSLTEAAEPVRRRRRLAAWVAAVAVLVIVAAVAWFLRPGGTGPATTPVVTPLTTSFAGTESSPSFSPDGNFVAFAWNGESEDNYDIYVKLIGAPTLSRLTTDPGMDFAPAWSPDGRFIAFGRVSPEERRGALVLISAIGGSERILSEVVIENENIQASPPPIRIVSWLPDSERLIVMAPPVAEPGLYLFTIDTGEMKRLTAANDFSPAVSPDGRLVAFSRIVEPHATEIHLLALNEDGMPDGEPRRLTFLNRISHSPAWTPDGREIVFVSTEEPMRELRGAGELLRMSVSGSGPPEPLGFPAESASWPAISLQGNRLVHLKSITDVNIWRMPLSKSGRPAGPATRLASSTRRDAFPEYSPDGKRIAFVSERAGSDGVWISDADGHNSMQVYSSTGGNLWGPNWSPDGQRLVYESGEGGNYDIYLVRASGGQPTRLTKELSAEGWPSWSRDGKWVYFASNRSGEFQIWKMPVDSAGNPGEAVQVTQNGGFVALESTDGEFLYYTKTGKQFSSLWKMPVSRGDEVQLTQPVLKPHDLTVTEREIYFISAPSPDGVSSIQHLDIESGKVSEITPLAGEPEFGLSLSPDGQYLLYTQRDIADVNLMLVENFR